MSAVFDRIVGQEVAVAALRAAAAAPVHAYLIIGGEGVGASSVASCFAASLLCAQGGCGDCEHCTAVLVGGHPDVALFRRKGAAISVDEAREAVARSMRSPRAAARQVIVIEDLELVENAAPVLLKAVEEPPETTVFVLLAEDLTPDLETIASRCVKVELRGLDPVTIVQVLTAEGVEPERAASIAVASGGRLDRARLLAHDDGFARRQALWTGLPGRIDDTGATVAQAVDDILAETDALVEVLKSEQDAALRQLEAAAAANGERSVRGRAEIEARHRRQQRRLRTDELRAGLASLARAYRERLDVVGGPGERKRAAEVASALAAIDQAVDMLVRNPNEQLLLQALILRLCGAA